MWWRSLAGRAWLKRGAFGKLSLPGGGVGLQAGEGGVGGVEECIPVVRGGGGFEDGLSRFAVLSSQFGEYGHGFCADSDCRVLRDSCHVWDASLIMPSAGQAAGTLTLRRASAAQASHAAAKHIRIGIAGL